MEAGPRSSTQTVVGRIGDLYYSHALGEWRVLADEGSRRATLDEVERVSGR